MLNDLHLLTQVVFTLAFVDLIVRCGIQLLLVDENAAELTDVVHQHLKTHHRIKLLKQILLVGVEQIQRLRHPV